MHKVKQTISRSIPYLGLLSALICLIISIPIALKTLKDYRIYQHYSTRQLEIIAQQSQATPQELQIIDISNQVHDNPLHIALITGHGTDIHGFYDSGAVAFDMSYEHTHIQYIATLIKANLETLGGAVTLFDENVYRNIKYHGALYDFSPYDFVIEIHFNASEHGLYSGTQIIYNTYNDSDLTVHYAVSNALQLITGNSIVYSDDEFITQQTIAQQGIPSMLLEVVHIDNQSDYTLYMNHQDAIAQAISDSLVTSLKAKEARSK
ncbi:hypothetical protein AOC36_02345 [Erysipelothrix larvae]|uniref:MurNAc-LAA domain-containing protein n=1 Tax=Erysipelothrix larvae TaxID=1514105 RepID=A0A0X8GZ12_9FIRM|nr:N-acetylmuramoyl-L-alanine amidase [Erysipelothrix larvae]AMC92864.1 hypothetical protein AOC36_02345 [Erysipelothrix larvae]